MSQRNHLSQTSQRFSQRRITQQITIIFLLSFLFISQPEPAIQAQRNEYNWFPPVIISPEYAPELLNVAQFPAIATDNDGNAHIFWASQRRVPESAFGGYDTVVYCAIRNDFCRDPIEILAYSWRQSEITAHPSVVIDAQNTLHIVTRGIGAQASVPRLYYQRVPIEGINNIDNWSAPFALSGRNRVSYSDIIIDENDTLHVAWSAADPSTCLI